MSKDIILVIVESPGKINKIESILNELYPKKRFIVMASVGHIIDLCKKNLSVDVDDKFKPEYEPIDSKKKEVIKKLKLGAKNASEVLLATDEDREGEMIAWSLKETLKLDNVKRIVFNSITKEEIKKAVENPTIIDENMVNAQKTRRILDRLLGYKISPILWKSANQPLSAGRVQSVVVELIIDKENEINDFIKNSKGSYYKFIGELLHKSEMLKCNLINKSKKNKIEIENSDENEESNNNNKKVKIENKEKALELMNILKESEYKVIEILEKERIQRPSPPFTTSTLQQEAARKLGFSVKQTMSSAQRLYEAGLITYMRTDSVNLSDDAIKQISKFVKEQYGKEYLNIIKYKSKSGNTQEAHEAVRPSNISKKGIDMNAKITGSEVSLYNLIWKRTVSSQMSAAKFSVTNIIIDITKSKKYNFLSAVEKLKFKGYLSVYNYNDEKDKDILNKIPKKNDKLQIKCVKGLEEFDKPPTRYNEASLVNKLDPKNLNIGRPATYSSIIDKIQDKRYVTKQDINGIEKQIINLILESNKISEEKTKILLGKESNKLVPTDIGKLVTSFLISNFPEFMDYKFTAKMEDELDEISEGKKIWHKILDKFYKKLIPLIEKASLENKKILDSTSKILGKYTNTNNEIIARVGKYGPMLEMTIEGTKKPMYAPIKLPLTLENITLKDAIKVFEYPKEICKYKRNKVLLYNGKYGPYLKIGKDSHSIKLEENEKFDESKITEEFVINLMESIEKKDLWKESDNNYAYTILNGPYGKYVNIKNLTKKSAKPYNVSLNDKIDLENLTLEKLKLLIEKKKNTKFKKFKKN